MEEIELAEYFNDDLLEVYNEEFVNFNAPIFKQCSDIILRKLKNFLFDRGVYIRKSNISHIKALSELQGKIENIWPRDLQNPSEHIGSYKTKNFESPRLKQNRTNVENYFRNKITSDTELVQTHRESHNPDIKETIAENSNPKSVSNTQLGFKLAGLSKLYNASEKYTGDQSDNLNFKYSIFKQKCKIATISHDDDIRSSIFIMFHDQALEFYHLRCNDEITVNDVIGLMREQFEGSQKQRNAQIEWNNMNLRYFASKYPDQSLLNSFEAMIRQLRTMQLCLRTNFQDEITLCDGWLAD